MKCTFARTPTFAAGIVALLAVAACSSDPVVAPIRDTPTPGDVRLTLGTEPDVGTIAITMTSATSEVTTYCGRTAADVFVADQNTITCGDGNDRPAVPTILNPGWSAAIAGGSVWIGPNSRSDSYSNGLPGSWGSYVGGTPATGSTTLSLDQLPGVHTYERTFTVPAGVQSPVINVEVAADNLVKAYLNNEELGGAPLTDDFFTATVKMYTKNFTVLGFKTGLNTLRFVVTNTRVKQTIGGADTPVGGVCPSEPGIYGHAGYDNIACRNPTGLLYKATVSWVVPTGFNVGDRVWNDVDADGVQDAGEAGINGVTVKLYNSSNVEIGSQNTSGNGGYLFTNIPAGSYTVCTTAGVPAGFSQTFDLNGPLDNCASFALNADRLDVDFGYKEGYLFTPCPAGSFTATNNPDGSLTMTFMQWPAPNDNSYGVNAIGWSGGHTFGNLTGSDKAGFHVVDGTGVVRLSFNIDYLSAKTGTPSGYASLGPFGGDGDLVVGSFTNTTNAAGGDITWSTSLQRNLNETGYCVAGNCSAAGTNLLVNSPPADANYNLPAGSPYGQWDFRNSYTVTISAAKMNALRALYGGTLVGQPNATALHNSPGKACPPGTPTGDITYAAPTTKDRIVTIQVTNSTSGTVYLTSLLLNWPSATNGLLKKVKLGGDVLYDNPDIAGGVANLTAALLVADQNKRKIDKGKTEALTFEFEKNVAPVPTGYKLTVNFGATVLNIIP